MAMQLHKVEQRNNFNNERNVQALLFKEEIDKYAAQISPNIKDLTNLVGRVNCFLGASSLIIKQDNFKQQLGVVRKKIIQVIQGERENLLGDFRRTKALEREKLIKNFFDDLKIHQYTGNKLEFITKIFNILDDDIGAGVLQRISTEFNKQEHEKYTQSIENYCNAKLSNNLQLKKTIDQISNIINANELYPAVKIDGTKDTCGFNSITYHFIQEILFNEKIYPHFLQTEASKFLLILFNKIYQVTCSWEHIKSLIKKEDSPLFNNRLFSILYKEILGEDFMNAKKNGVLKTLANNFNTLAVAWKYSGDDYPATVQGIQNFTQAYNKGDPSVLANLEYLIQYKKNTTDNIQTPEDYYSSVGFLKTANYCKDPTTAITTSPSNIANIAKKIALFNVEFFEARGGMDHVKSASGSYIGSLSGIDFLHGYNVLPLILVNGAGSHWTVFSHKSTAYNEKLEKDNRNIMELSFGRFAKLVKSKVLSYTQDAGGIASKPSPKLATLDKVYNKLEFLKAQINLQVLKANNSERELLLLREELDQLFTMVDDYYQQNNSCYNGRDDIVKELLKLKQELASIFKTINASSSSVVWPDSYNWKIAGAVVFVGANAIKYCAKFKNI